MNAEVVAEWFRLQGYSVVRTPSCHWYNKGPRAFQAIPWNWRINPAAEELDILFRKHAALAIRFSAPLTFSAGMVSYHAICDCKSYDLGVLPRQSQQNVNRGLAHFVIEPIPFSRMATEGWDLHVDTLRRHGRRDVEPRENWYRKWKLAADLPGFEAWGALLGCKLSSALVLVRIDDWNIMLSQQSLSQHLSLKPNHALVYTATKELMSRATTKSILFSIQSLDAPERVDAFKFRMGYRPIILKQYVAFNPLVTWLISKQTLGVIKTLLRWDPSNPVLPKAAGMMRVSIEGKKPLIEQKVPDIVKPMSTEILEGFPALRGALPGRANVRTTPSELSLE